MNILIFKDGSLYNQHKLNSLDKALKLNLNYQKKDINKVLSLEKKRLQHNYKSGWTYYQAKKLNLLNVFYFLQKEGKVGKKSPIKQCENKNLLSIELVPESCWFSNVRSHINKEEWNKLKKITAKKAHYICEICYGRGSKWPVECHEIWHYDDVNKIQSLQGLIALCPSCHEVKHMGFANIQGRGDIAIKHLAKVNNWSHEYCLQYVDRQFEVWKERSNYKWVLDIKYLEQYDIYIEQNITDKKIDITMIQYTNFFTKIWGFFLKYIKIIPQTNKSNQETKQ